MSLDPGPPKFKEVTDFFFNWVFLLYEWIRTCKADNYTHVVASSITDNVAVQTPVGTLSDTQTALDGNEWNMPENNSNPAIDVDFGFTSVTRIRGVVFNARYTGSASHYMTVAIRDYTAGADRNLMNFSTTASDNYRTVLIPDDTNFIDGSGNAQISFHHSPGVGNTSHDLYVDYIALLN